MRLKLIPFEALSTLTKCLKSEHAKVVATNGCFDVLHPGHIAYLETARMLGDYLVIGLNSDNSVKQLKGPNRPVSDQMTRAIMLSQLSCVDYVCIFDDIRATSFLSELKPDVWVKGGDYTFDTVNKEEREAVVSNGGVIRFIPFTFDISTSKILSKVG